MNGLRITFAAGVAAAVACTSLPARADSESGLAIGVRTGYGAPLGNAYQGETLASFQGGMLPFWFDLGYRFNPHWYAGVWYQYGITAPPTGPCAQQFPGGTCDGNDQRFGINVHYHILPDQFVDPWVGLGIGYESARINVDNANGAGETSFIASGVQFLDLQVGADLRASDKIPFGPFIDLSFGQYGAFSDKDANGNSTSVTGNYQTSMHEWLTLGIRGQFNL